MGNLPADRVSPPEINTAKFTRLVHRLDQAALIKLHDDLYPQIYRYALYRLGQRKASQEVAADAFLKLVGLVRQRNLPVNLRSWLLAAASEQVQAYLESPSPNHLVGPGGEESDLAKYGALFRRSLHKLSPSQQNFMALRFSQDCSFAEVASWLNFQEGELRSLQFQSLNALLGALGGKIILGSDESLERALQVCLQHLQAGSRLDELSAAYPKWSEELHALLEVAYFAQYPGGTDPRQKPAIQAGMDGLEESMAASRAELLQAAQVSLPRARAGGGWRWLALVIAVVILLAACGSMLAVVSTMVLPGGFMRSVRLGYENVRLALTSASASRLKAELDYDRRRLEEAREILDQGKEMPVIFSGPLLQEGAAWQIAGIPIIVTDQTEMLGDVLPGYSVTVQGVTTGDGSVMADQLQMREIQVKGEIQSLSENSLQVGDLQVTVTPKTIWQGQAEVGKRVIVYLLLPGSGAPEARLIEVIE